MFVLRFLPKEKQTNKQTKKQTSPDISPHISNHSPQIGTKADAIFSKKINK